jgi:tetratricopeptide (TPR) repeat protein
VALAKDQFEEAEQAFEAALKIAPDNAEAVEGLVSAKSGQAVAKKAGEDEGKKKKSVDKLLTEGKKAAAEKKYAAAVLALESARQLDPANTDVLTALNGAKTALEEDQAQKKALAEFRKHIDAGKAAMKAERFDDAVKEYMAAVRLMPDDLEAQQGQKQAENKIAALADKQKRQDAFDALLKRGQDALAETRFKDAVLSLEAAARIIPDDKEAARALRKAKASLKEVRSSNPELLARAGQLLAAGRIEGAKKLADEAAAAWAEDEQAKKVQRSIEQATDNVKTRQAAFARYNEQAATALDALRYADAVTAYNQALRLYPDDATVLLRLNRVKKLLERETLARRDADKLIRLGTLALGRRAYGEAEKYFAQAVRKQPLDETAAAGLSQARYGRYMSEGQAAYRAGRKALAVQAFEAALAEKPGDPTAANMVRQARAMTAVPGAGQPRDNRPTKRGAGGPAGKEGGGGAGAGKKGRQPAGGQRPGP